jgi:hypothetical protein
MQEKALRLIASKLETSLVVEGELSDKGLQALSHAEGSMVLELARALVEGLEEKESLSETWTRTRRKEIEADLTGIEKKATVREVSKTVSQVGNRVLTVDIIESTRPRKKKVTRLQVSEEDLENVFKEQGKPIQFAGRFDRLGSNAEELSQDWQAILSSPNQNPPFCHGGWA